MDAVSYSLASKQAQRIEKFIENPDSTSGIVTVPKVIGAGENITIPSGRIAVLPNVQVDGTLNIEGEVFIPSGATFSKVVETEGNQTIADVKTFTSSPIVPTPTAGDNSTQVATTAFVKAKSEADSIGVGQTWQDVTASRSLGVAYQNTTGKAIQICVTYYGNSYLQSSVDGVTWVNIGTSAGTTISSKTPTIPSANFYRLPAGATISCWSELR